MVYLSMQKGEIKGGSKCGVIKEREGSTYEVKLSQALLSSHETTVAYLYLLSCHPFVCNKSLSILQYSGIFIKHLMWDAS